MEHPGTFLVEWSEQFVQWKNELVDTVLDQLDETAPVVAMLPDGSIGQVRLVGPVTGDNAVQRRIGMAAVFANPDDPAPTLAPVLIIGQSVSMQAGNA